MLLNWIWFQSVFGSFKFFITTVFLFYYLLFHCYVKHQLFSLCARLNWLLVCQFWSGNSIVFRKYLRKMNIYALIKGIDMIKGKTTTTTTTTTTTITTSTTAAAVAAAAATTITVVVVVFVVVAMIRCSWVLVQKQTWLTTSNCSWIEASVDILTQVSYYINSSLLRGLRSLYLLQKSFIETEL